MKLGFDTNYIPHADREETIREAIWRHVVKVEITHHPDSHRIQAVGAISSVGRVGVCSVKSNATTIRRTPKLARDDFEPSIFLGLQISGCSMVIQDGREATLRAGDMAVYDTTRPYTLLNEQGIHQHYFRVPRSDLALPDRAIATMTAVRLGQDNPIAALATTYFGRLARLQDPPIPTSRAEAIEVPSIELVRALLATSLCDPVLAAEPLENTIELRIFEYMRAHLADRDLSARGIAARHNISARQLYKILGRSGVTPADWIRARRLEECRKDLANPCTKHMTIEAIARRWGITDAPYFSRAFKKAYGISPRKWRALRERWG
jgi:AraC-like DNA-binding protein